MFFFSDRTDVLYYLLLRQTYACKPVCHSKIKEFWKFLGVGFSDISYGLKLPVTCVQLFTRISGISCQLQGFGVVLFEINIREVLKKSKFLFHLAILNSKVAVDLLRINATPEK